VKRKKKFQEMAARVRKTRDALTIDGKKKSQTEFAALLGVKKSAVSSWEQGSPEPSAQNYIKLAGASLDYEDIEWFLAKAGVDSKILHNYADRLTSRRTAPLKDGIDIWPLKGSGTPFQFPGWMVPNRLSAHFVRVNEHDETCFGHGDVLLIDTSETALSQMGDGSLVAVSSVLVINSTAKLAGRQRKQKIDASFLHVGFLRKQDAGHGVFHMMLEMPGGKAVLLGSSAGPQDVIPEHLAVLGRVVAWAAVGRRQFSET
jgi:transcriptional regulator with XRE-family HTH domain